MAVYILENLFYVIRGEQKLIVASHCEILEQEGDNWEYYLIRLRQIYGGNFIFHAVSKSVPLCPNRPFGYSELNSYFNMSL
jgi:hypothetical protein